jgi:hypothetical protein
MSDVSWAMEPHSENPFNEETLEYAEFLCWQVANALISVNTARRRLADIQQVPK